MRAETTSLAEPDFDSSVGGPHFKKPRVLIWSETLFHRVRLSSILACSFEVVTGAPDESLATTMAALAPPPSMVILPVYGSRPETIDLITELRRASGVREIPILGITTLDRSGLDLRALRALGVVGLIDKTATPEHVLFRATQVVLPVLGSRRLVRVPVFFPVDLETARHTATEYALSLSVGGMGLTSERPLDPNEEVRLTFRLDPKVELHTLEARVIYCRAVPSAFQEAGVFFQALGDDRRRLLQEWVARSVA